MRRNLKPEEIHVWYVHNQEERYREGRRYETERVAMAAARLRNEVVTKEVYALRYIQTERSPGKA